MLSPVQFSPAECTQFLLKLGQSTRSLRSSKSDCRADVGAGWQSSICSVSDSETLQSIASCRYLSTEVCLSFDYSKVSERGLWASLIADKDSRDSMSAGAASCASRTIYENSCASLATDATSCASQIPGTQSSGVG